MNCIECNQLINEKGIQFRCCDALVCGLICSRNRVIKIKKFDPLMNNPDNWNCLKNKIEKNKSLKNLDNLGMPYESIKLNKPIPIPLIKTNVINIKNYQEENKYSNINLNTKISEMLVKGSIMILLGLYLKKQYSILIFR